MQKKIVSIYHPKGLPIRERNSATAGPPAGGDHRTAAGPLPARLAKPCTHADALPASAAPSDAVAPLAACTRDDVVHRGLNSGEDHQQERAHHACATPRRRHAPAHLQRPEPPCSAAAFLQSEPGEPPLSTSPAPLRRDKDFRYMATSDLLAELSKETFKPDSDGERKICKCVLKLLNDQSSDVQGLAVKWCVPCPPSSPGRVRVAGSVMASSDSLTAARPAAAQPFAARAQGARAAGGGNHGDAGHAGAGRTTSAHCTLECAPMHCAVRCRCSPARRSSATSAQSA